jgi:uncharacterized membrane protein
LYHKSIKKKMETKENNGISGSFLIPSVSSSYNISWENLRRNFVELLLLTIIAIAASIPAGIMRVGAEATGFGAGGVFLGLFGIVFWLFVSAPITYGVAYVFLQLIRKEKFDVGAVFEGFRSNYINVILANLLTSAIIIAGFLFLIIPGIIFACKLAFVPYLVLDKKMEAVEAVKTSWEMTKGHTVTIFLIGLLAIPIAILGLLMLVVGLIPASMWIEGAFAAIYFTVDKQQNPEIEEEVIVAVEE